MGRGRSMLGTCLLLGVMSVLVTGAPGGKDPGPVTPAEAIHAAVGSSLGTVQDWIAQKDFRSAGQASLELAAIIDLYARQGSDAGWKARVASLSAAASRLASAVRTRDAVECRKQLDEGKTLLRDLEKRNPGTPSRGSARLTGSLRTWMFLVDAAYSDAKRAETPRELERLAVGLAEQMIAVEQLRGDARWRKLSVEVRAAAKTVAAKAREKDLPAARAALRTVYNRCEVCHQAKGR